MTAKCEKGIINPHTSTINHKVKKQIYKIYCKFITYFTILYKEVTQ